MSLGQTPKQGEMWRSTSAYCEAKLSPTSIYSLLHRECHRLFPDEAFTDLFRDIGRRSIPPRIVAVVMVLQRLEGLSDREAVERFSFDIRWKYAAGGLDFEYPGFVHTVLVDMRERLRQSQDPDRIFRTVLDVAKAAGLVGRRRVLDSTPLYDAVATQDTVTMIRSAIRALLRAAGDELVAQLRGALKRDDDYSTAGKPACDWEDRAAREALVDALARDAYALLAHLDGHALAVPVREAAVLLATVVGQDLEQTEDGTFRIARRVAPDRVISTVDPYARHGHKTQARGFDGYKGHIALDPDSELITSSTVTPGNAADGSVAKELLKEALETEAQKQDEQQTKEGSPEANDSLAPEPVEVYGDSSYGTGEVLEHLENAGAVAHVKVQAPASPDGRFTKDAFHIDLASDTVTCPAGQLVQIRRRKDGSGIASFGARCGKCPLAASCTKSKEGRNVTVNQREHLLQHARTQQRSPAWRAGYKATRPKVERKLAHLMRRRHGGRRARLRGTERVTRDFTMLCAAENLRRLAALGLRHDERSRTRWAV
ncbi:transposase [Polyangium fumosum]|uniref:IS1182 family transposase n=1 Tax=Polyangium fumosum TaxID=889272 RepID=A0A4U1I5K8_9BACT|nr:transposase [Polyangium fumosum]TKC88629.1 IS1182 family transposase [Polyangium fumosum]